MGEAEGVDSEPELGGEERQERERCWSCHDGGFGVHDFECKTVSFDLGVWW